jgi:hypothetical protein
MGVLTWAQRFVSTVRSYQRIFKKDNPDVKAILCDLGKIAPVDPTSKVAKPYRDNEVFIMIGRRQVVSHILAKINMTEEELNNIIKQDQLKQQQNESVKG